MSAKQLFISVALTVLFMMNIHSGFSQVEKQPQSRFSHRGVKVTAGTGSFEMISELKLMEGDGGFLSLGYGFTDRFSIWLTATGSEHSSTVSDTSKKKFAGLELNLQHKFETGSRLQPYGKLGVGLYGLEEHNSDLSLIGAGINLGFGLDYFFSRHFGVGAEVIFKKLDYIKQSRMTEEGDLITDLSPNLNGDTAGFMLTFTIQ